MDREKLKALLERSTELGASPDTGIQLQEWLESFAANVKARALDVKNRVDELLDHTSSVEQELKNTFNSFRLLSNTQFIENRVYEEDETLLVKVAQGERPLRLQNHADDVVPRFREAVHSAWSAHELVSKSSRTREVKHRRLPFIIGTEEFNRDPQGGVQDAGSSSSTSNHDYDSETEKDGAHMAAAMIGSGVLSEGEWSEPSTDEQDNQEPAVSAALDFRAMLEAALRGPYIPYDDGLRVETASTSLHSGTTAKEDAGVSPRVEQGNLELNKDALHDILGKITCEADPHLFRSHATVSRQRSSPTSTSSVSDEEDKTDGEVQPEQQSTSPAKETRENNDEPPAMKMQGEANASSSEDSIEEFRQSSTTSHATVLRPKSLFDEDLDDDQKVLKNSEETVQEQVPDNAVKRTNFSSLLFGDDDDDEDEDETGLFGTAGRANAHL